MKSGFWINYDTDKKFPVNEHERWLRKRGNAKKLGLSKKVIASFKEFKPIKDRDKFLTFVMKHAPVIRVRGHGNHVTFEYSSRSRNAPMDSIWLWGLKNAGAYTGLYIVNFATGEKTSIYWKDFKEAMDSGGASAVMRVATVDNTLIASHLVKMAKTLIAGKKEDILMDILKDSNLDQIAEDLANQIIKPVVEYYKIAEKDPDKATKYLYKASGKKLRPKKDFSLKKCMGDYIVTIDYAPNRKGLYLNIAQEDYMQIKVLSVDTMEWGYAKGRIKSLIMGLKEEISDLIEHEMGHYYLQKAGDVEECIYLSDPRGFKRYFYDSQEMVLHGKVIFNQIKRQMSNYDEFEPQKIERIVRRYVRDLPIDTNAPRGVPFPKALQERYVKHIIKHYFS